MSWAGWVAHRSASASGAGGLAPCPPFSERPASSVGFGRTPRPKPDRTLILTGANLAEPNPNSAEACPKLVETPSEVGRVPAQHHWTPAQNVVEAMQVCAKPVVFLQTRLVVAVAL